jgi:hypothetical protein
MGASMADMRLRNRAGCRRVGDPRCGTEASRSSRCLTSPDRRSPVERDPTRMCSLLVGLPEVTVLAVEENCGRTVEDRSLSLSRPRCGGRAQVKDRQRMLVGVPVFDRPGAPTGATHHSRPSWLQKPIRFTASVADSSPCHERLSSEAFARYDPLMVPSSWRRTGSRLHAPRRTCSDGKTIPVHSGAEP